MIRCLVGWLAKTLRRKQTKLPEIQSWGSRFIFFYSKWITEELRNYLFWTFTVPILSESASDYQFSSPPPPPPNLNSGRSSAITHYYQQPRVDRFGLLALTSFRGGCFARSSWSSSSSSEYSWMYVAAALRNCNILGRRICLEKWMNDQPSTDRPAEPSHSGCGFVVKSLNII